MKHLIRSAASSAIAALDRLFCCPWMKNKQSIILQGHFYPGSAGYENLELARTLSYLKNHFEIVSVSENLKRLSEPTSKPLLSFAIDDFGKGFTEYSYPHFKKNCIPFTIGICPGLFTSMTNDLSPNHVVRIRSNRNAEFETDSLSDLKHIISEHPVEVCSHTMSHALLSKLDKNEKEFEITESKKILEQITSKPVNGFIYPFGYGYLINKYHTQMLRNAGYQYAISTLMGGTSLDERWGLKRMNADVDFNATRANATFLWTKMKEE